MNSVSRTIAAPTRLSGVEAPEVSPTDRSPSSGNHPRVVTSAPILLAAGTQTQALGVNLIAPNTKFQKRWNQVDLSAKRTFKYGRREFQGQFAVFNVTNGNVVLQEVQTYGATLGQPQNFLQARMMRLALLINF